MTARVWVYCQLCGNATATAADIATFRTSDGAEVEGVRTVCQREACASESVMLPLAATIAVMAAKREVA